MRAADLVVVGVPALASLNVCVHAVVVTDAVILDAAARCSRCAYLAVGDEIRADGLSLEARIDEVHWRGDERRERARHRAREQ